MGKVVDTLEEAFDRCDRKGKGDNYFFTFEEHMRGEILYRGEICGTREYIKEWIHDKA